MSQNDEPRGFGAEYQWCGEWRVRATALQDGEARAGTCVRRASTDRALVVDGDEDALLYGPPQYSPSRIAPDVSTARATDARQTHDSRATNAAPQTCRSRQTHYRSTTNA